MTSASARGALFAIVLAAIAIGCLPAAKPSRVEVARAAQGSGDAEALGAWLLAELLAPGGNSAGAAKARAELARLGDKGLFASLGRAIDADAHGLLPAAADAYLAAVDAARTSGRADAPLLAWLATVRLEAMRPAVAGLWQKSQATVRRAIDAPENIGWRARTNLVEWYALETHRTQPAGMLDRIARQHGCVKQARFAGPFGRGGPGDHRVRFAAERAAPWPARFDPEGGARGGEVVPAEHRGCALFARQTHGEGIYYVQTFVEITHPTDVIVAVSGAYSLSIDDRVLLQRDEAVWGGWPRLAVRVGLAPGRHRILARLGRAETSIRLLQPDGLPLVPATSAEPDAGARRFSADDSLPYVLTEPKLLADPSPLEPFLRSAGVKPFAPVAAAAIDTGDPSTRFAAATIAAMEGYRDIASVLLEPLVEPEKAAPLALFQASQFVEGDPIFSGENARSMARELKTRALAGDPDLWGAALWLAMDRGGQSRPAETARELERLAARFPLVPTIGSQLAAVYSQLGWTVEHTQAIESLAKRFPDDVPTLEALLEVEERRGRLSDADRLVARIRELDPNHEVAVRRALKRRDFHGAIAELRRIESLRGDRRDVALRLADLLARAGHKSGGAGEAMKKLELAVEQSPRDGAARLALADARFASGDRRALEHAMVEAIRTGAESAPLREAIELVEGATALEPYRKKGLQIIREAEQKGIQLPGTAARVLDYAALWIAADGSARMLEHTILRVQSREGIAQQAERQLPQGMLLTLRTVKKDGRILEPEIVAAKPTVTMPHLEIGDYIETESIWVIPGDGEGRRFRSPRWYFREPNISYHLSQLVVISPKSRPLAIEIGGQVPEPEIEKSEGLEVRRWTVKGSLALPEEPGAPPIEEFLPSVQVGWGVDVDAQLERVADARAGGFPADPRLLRIAKTIATGKLGRALDSVSKDERARRIYRWVVDNIRPGQERWPARIVTSKSGDATEAFIYLCRLAGVDARLGAVQSRLAPPPRGELSGIDAFATTAVRVRTDHGARWLLVRLRQAPYGFLPSSLSEQPAVLLDRAAPPTSPGRHALHRERTSTGGAIDGVDHRGKLKLHADGSAELVLDEEFHGRYAIVIRTALAELESNADDKRRELIEQRLIGGKLPGARVAKLTIHNLDDLDAPLRMTLKVEVPSFARVTDKGLTFEVPFLGSMEPMVALASRQSPLYLGDSARSHVVMEVEPPPGGKLSSTLASLKVEGPRLTVRVADRLEKGVIILDREADLPAGRVQPSEYGEFRELVLSADRELNQPIRIDVPPR